MTEHDHLLASSPSIHGSPNGCIDFGMSSLSGSVSGKERLKVIEIPLDRIVHFNCLCPFVVGIDLWVSVFAAFQAISAGMQEGLIA